MSPLPCPNRPKILTLISEQVYKTEKPNYLDWGGQQEPAHGSYKIQEKAINKTLQLLGVGL